MTWTTDELEQIGSSTEIKLSSRRPDGSLSRWTIMWVVSVGGTVYVRSAYGPDSAWYRRARRYGQGCIRADGVEHDVTVADVPADDAAMHAALDAAYHSKYDRYGPQIVGTVVGRDAAAVTLRLERH